MATGIKVTLGNPGTLDAGFSGDGKVSTAIGPGDAAAGLSVLLQPDGKLVLGGHSINGTDEDFAVVRYNADGSLDSGFGSGGKVVAGFGAGNDGILRLVLQPDGKLVAAGVADNGADFDMAFARWNANGTPDGGFGGGRFRLPFGTGDDFAFGLALQSDGKLVAAGGAGATSDFALLRLNPDGTPDASFGTGGKVTTPVGASNDAAIAVLVQPNGRILAAGTTTTGGNYDIALVRYLANGSLDTGFGGGDGVVVTAVGSGMDLPYSMALQADGRILVAGFSSNGSNDDFALVRYLANGSLDASFGGGDGIVTTAIGAGDDIGAGIALLADGKIVLAGSTYPGAFGSTNGDFALVCYNPDGSLYAPFGTGGKAVLPFAAGDDSATAVVVLPDGRIVAGGNSNSGGNDDFAALRLYGASNRMNGTANNDTLTGAAGEDTLFGAAGIDVLKGLGGKDALHGGGGNDKLTGGTGADKFYFDFALNATSNKDTLLDFSHAQADKIVLDDDIFLRFAGKTAIAPGNLRIGAAAADSNDFIIYNPGTGELTYDANGNLAGGAKVFAVLGAATHPATLVAADFQVIA